MGSNDRPPPHVPSHVVPVCNALLQIGGSLWTICYVLFVLEARKSKSYGMPIFALALNFAWEAVYAFYVAESLLETCVFTSWLLVDCGIVVYTLKYAKYEWGHSPHIARHLGSIFVTMTVGALVGHWAFAKWWIDNEIGKREGKIYRGVVGPDTSELGFWSALFCQAYLSAASLCQLVIRQHSGGVSWSIWATRTFGSIIGLYLVYGLEWYYWHDAHGYFMSPFAIFLWLSSLICDGIYPYALWRVRRTESILRSGRRVSGSAGKQHDE